MLGAWGVNAEQRVGRDVFRVVEKIAEIEVAAPVERDALPTGERLGGSLIGGLIGGLRSRLSNGPVGGLSGCKESIGSVAGVEVFGEGSGDPVPEGDPLLSGVKFEALAGIGGGLGPVAGGGVDFGFEAPVGGAGGVVSEIVVRSLGVAWGARAAR